MVVVAYGVPSAHPFLVAAPHACEQNIFVSVLAFERVERVLKDELLQVKAALGDLLGKGVEVKENLQGYQYLRTELLVPYSDAAESGSSGSAQRVKMKACITIGDVYGPQHAIDTAVQLQEYKSFRPLFLFLKALLRQRGLDNADDGGLPSYILYCMVR